MRLGYEVFYLLQWVIFLVRMVLSITYGILQFISKPGSRYIVPAAVALGGYYRLEWLQEQVVDVIYHYNNRDTPSILVTMQRQVQQAYYGHAIDPRMLDVGLGVLFVLACGTYIVVSRILAVVLSAFPPFTRPLPPVRRIRMKAAPITSAVVQLIVPKLRRWRWQLRMEA
jgi:hypothetical protein